MTHKSSREKSHIEIKNNNADIHSIINYGLNVDKILSACSNELFSLDKEAKEVLEILAINGPLTEYGITKIGNNYNLSRDSIRRRIFGTSTFPSLLNHKFIQIIATEKHRTGKEIKRFGLTFKGLLGTLSRIKFEEIYMSKRYYSEIKNLVKDDQNFIDLALEYAKSHITLILLWSKLNNLNLLSNSSIENFFTEDKTNNCMRIGLLNDINENKMKIYEQVTTKYYVLKYAMFSMVKKLSTKTISHLYSDNKTKNIFKDYKREKRNPKEFFIIYCIKDWVLNIEVANSYPNDKDRFEYAKYVFDGQFKTGNFFEWDVQEELDSMYRKIAKKCGLKMSSVKILNLSKNKA